MINRSEWQRQKWFPREEAAKQSETTHTSWWVGLIGICQESKTRLLILGTGTRSFSSANREKARSLLAVARDSIKGYVCGKISYSIPLSPSITRFSNYLLPNSWLICLRRVASRQSYCLMAIASRSTMWISAEQWSLRSCNAYSRTKGWFTRGTTSGIATIDCDSWLERDNAVRDLSVWSECFKGSIL